MLDADVLGEELGALVLEHVRASTAPLIVQIQALEARIAALPKPEKGKDADPEVIRLQVAEAVAALPKPKDAAPIDLAWLSGVVSEAAAKAVEAIPKPKDAPPVDLAWLSGTVSEAAAKAVQAIPRPKDAPPVDLAWLSGVVSEAAAKAVDAIPKPRNGNDADPEMIRLVAAETLPAMVDKAQAMLARRMQDNLDAMRRDVFAEVKAIPVPSNGLDADAEAIATEVLEKVTKAIPIPEKGKDADPEFVRSVVRDEVSRAVAALPTPKEGEPGKSVDLGELTGHITRAAAMAVAAIPAPKNGKDFEPELLRSEVVREVERAVALIPKPEPGRSLTVEDIRPILQGEVAKSVLDLERRATETLQRAVDNMPKPENGKDGLDLDAFGLELDEDGRTLKFTLTSGGEQFVKAIKVPWQLYRDVFVQGHPYAKGDNFTYGGSVWMTVKDSAGTERPGDDSGVYRLAVKRGADAK